MYSLSLKQVPEEGAYQEKGLHLSPAELGLGGPFDPAGVLLRFEFKRYLDKVFGQIHAETQVRLECSRCLKAFEAPLQVDFAMQFEPKDGLRDSDADDEDPGLSMAFYEGDELPVGEELRQELELQLPFAPQCRTDCKGLCPRCGHDLNHGDCPCPKGPQGGAFAGLDQLLKQQEP
jgi:uncharacterized metal-binding protein YceD (DUF177 family)